MTILHSIILGIVQGITEFFPISSSAHLIAIRYLFNFQGELTEKNWLIFDIALHFGTMMAIAIYFFKDFIKMFKEGFDFRQKDKSIKNKKLRFKNLTTSGKMLWYIIAACVPGAIAALVFSDYIEGAIRGNPLIIAITLTIMGVILYLVDKYSPSKENIENITFRQALFIGIGQMFAIIPGFSRSGTTMTVARALNLDRESSAKFSFLLGAPVMLGAAVIGLKDLTIAMVNAQFIIGVLVSFLVGLIAIKTLMKIVKKIGFGIFAIYRIALALVLVTVMIIR